MLLLLLLLLLLPLLLPNNGKLAQAYRQGGSRQVHWMVEAGRGSAKGGVAEWAAHVASVGAISGLVGCCGRFSVAANGTWFDEWPKSKYPLSTWEFVHNLGITMHFVVTVEQRALLNHTAVLAIPTAVQTVRF